MEARIDDRDWFASRLAAGDTIAAIGEAAGVSRQTATAWRKRHGLHANNTRTRDRPPVDQMAADYARTGSVRALAAEYGISPAVAHTWLFEAGIDMEPPGRRRAGIDVADVHARRERGESWATIAADVGVAVETLRRRVGAAGP